ncbi:MAG: YdiU family protein [Mariprofundus sp.]|nr:YdiU family protein [Mariprofundus sp.]
MTTKKKNSNYKLQFDNRFTRLLPGESEQLNQPRQVFQACYSRVKPLQPSQPALIIYASEVAELLNFPTDFCTSQTFEDIFSGKLLLPEMDPHASCYGGHQFGHWAGQLGDGRAINLGELLNDSHEHWMLQLKGAGPTPYSRSGDGLAVLRSSIREFLCSEAMFHLGIPTTRALSLVLSGNKVMRDMFYDGHKKLESGAVVCRAARSFIRFGSFQIFTARQEIKTVQQLLDHSIRHDFPHLGEPDKSCYLNWFRAVTLSTIHMVVEWMRVGFVHGVMNTDNMSVLGLTIDYGPYGWLEGYDPDWTPNTTDREMHRYSFGNQGDVAGWNLARLAEAIVPIIGEAEPLQALLNEYAIHYKSAWQNMMANKLGLVSFTEPDDSQLVDALEKILTLSEIDMSIFYRKLANIDATIDPEQCSDSQLIAPLMDAYYTPATLTEPTKIATANWLRRYIHRLQQDGLDNIKRKTTMNRHNPKYVLRNYLCQIAIDQAEAGDYSEIHRLHQLLKKPYDEQVDYESYASKRPEWARERAGCSMLSCSS